MEIDAEFQYKDHFIKCNARYLLPELYANAELEGLTLEITPQVDPSNKELLRELETAALDVLFEQAKEIRESAKYDWEIR